MQAISTNTPAQEKDFSARKFRHVRNSLAYEDMHIIRSKLAEFLQLNRIPKAHIGNLLLAVTEIFSNLIKHPARKADYIEIRASLSEAQVHLEVLDNSTPFADFDAKCKSALSHMDAAESGAEGRYGLGLVLSACKQPQYAAMETSGGLNRFRISHDAEDAPAAKPPHEHQRSKKKIFLVDDDPISLQIHQRMLDGIYEVILFEKAAEALRSFAEHQPDLIVSDLNMPEMDGMELRRQLSAVEGGNTTPFIFLSGQTDKEHNSYISHLGVDDFLCKPVAKERLHTVLSRLLHRSQQICAAMQGQFNHGITELLKPSLPEHYGLWTFVTRHKAVDAGGGDFILHHQTPTALMGVLADVMGHGKQAKFFSCVYAGYLRSMFRMYAGTLDTAHFLRYLSQSVDGDPLLESMIMTCQCFQFLPEGIIKIASAGHPCPILLRGNSAELINIAGPLPGLAGDRAYDMKTLRLLPGDRVIFMTDGFMEAFDRRGLAAEELVRRLQAVPVSSAAGLADALWDQFQELFKKQLAHRDDATIIIAEYGRKP